MALNAEEEKANKTKAAGADVDTETDTETEADPKLVKLVNQRRKLLDYLKATKPEKYQELVERLGLRR